MVEQIGRYNVDYAGEAWEYGMRYEMVIISEFDGNREVARKCFYFLNSAPRFRSTRTIDKYFKYPNYTRF